MIWFDYFSTECHFLAGIYDISVERKDGPGAQIKGEYGFQVCAAIASFSASPGWTILARIAEWPLR
jgi:hypothetical protein